MISLGAHTVLSMSVLILADLQPIAVPITRLECRDRTLWRKRLLKSGNTFGSHTAQLNAQSSPPIPSRPFYSRACVNGTKLAVGAQPPLVAVLRLRAPAGHENRISRDSCGPPGCPGTGVPPWATFKHTDLSIDTLFSAWAGPSLGLFHSFPDPLPTTVVSVALHSRRSVGMLLR